MAYYAFLNEENRVTEVITGRDENEIVEGVSDWEAFYGELRNQSCFRTSYNTYGGVHYTDGQPSDDQSKAFRYNFAGIGYTFNPDAGDAGGFVAPQPFDSWILSSETLLWEAPIPYPEDGSDYYWDEDSGDWLEIAE